MNSVQIMIFELLVFQENIELIPYGDYNDLSLINTDPTKQIPLVFVGITVRNQLGWVEAMK